jgi:hypothetical protein
VLVTRQFDLPGGATFADTVDNVPAGEIDARVDWPGTSDLNLYVTDTRCPGRIELLAAQCRVFAQMVGSAKPERIQFTTTATANYIYWVHNLGASSEMVTLELALTR